MTTPQVPEAPQAPEAPQDPLDVVNDDDAESVADSENMTIPGSIAGDTLRRANEQAPSAVAGETTRRDPGPHNDDWPCGNIGIYFGTWGNRKTWKNENPHGAGAVGHP